MKRRATGEKGEEREKGKESLEPRGANLSSHKKANQQQ